jgi:hypothetical protein
LGGMGHRLALNARGGSQGTVQARAAVWVRVSLTIGNVDRMHRWSAGLSDRMFVVAMVARPALCARRGLRWIGRRRASHIGDEPWDRIARFMSVWIPRS